MIRLRPLTWAGPVIRPPLAWSLAAEGCGTTAAGIVRATLLISFLQHTVAERWDGTRIFLWSLAIFSCLFLESEICGFDHVRIFDDVCVDHLLEIRCGTAAGRLCPPETPETLCCFAACSSLTVDGIGLIAGAFVELGSRAIPRAQDRQNWELSEFGAPQ